MIYPVSPQEAAEAAKQFLGFYPDIPASDPKGFAAGLVKTFSIYPKGVIDRAVDPVYGLPAKIKFLNLAAIRELLEDWDYEYRAEVRRHEKPLLLPEPEVNPEMQAKIQEGLRRLSKRLTLGFGPSTAE